MKKIKNILGLLLVLLLSISSFGCNVNNIVSNTDRLKIHYIDVRQADSELIQIGDQNILIDAGNNDNMAYDYLKSLGITKLDYVIATHPHADHIGNMATIIKNFQVDNFYAPKASTTTKTFENMVNALKNKNLKMTVPKVGDSLTIGDAKLTFLAPNSDKYEDVNNYSIVCKLKYGNTSFLFTGDAEDVSEGEILQKQLDIQADVLKVGHHGSHSSTTQEFLDKINPTYAIISCGKDNDYGHPHKETLDKLNKKGVKVFRTDLSGTIIATSDGSKISFNVDSDSKLASELNKKDAVKDNTVWVASKSSKVYHKDKECSGMKSPTSITLDEAKEIGLKPCSKCAVE